MRDHKQLRAFELADKVALGIYRLTSKFPVAETYGLTSQMRRAAVSVPSNIVEECARESKREYVQFLNVAFGSLRELHYQFSLADRLDYCKEKISSELESDIMETEKVLNALIRALRKEKKN